MTDTKGIEAVNKALIKLLKRNPDDHYDIKYVENLTRTIIGAYCKAEGVAMVTKEQLQSAKKLIEEFDNAQSAPLVAMANYGDIAISFLRSLVAAANGDRDE